LPEDTDQHGEGRDVITVGPVFTSEVDGAIAAQI
jgi:hypothetical protein